MREEERKEEMRRQRALESGSQASAEEGIEDGAQPAGGDGNNAGGDAGQDRDFNLSGNAGGAAPKPEPLYEDPLLLPSEKELAGLILNHGMSELEFETDSEYYDPEGFVTVADFIRDALEVDGHQFSNSIMRKIYDEYFDLYDSSPDMTQEDIVRTILNGEDTRLADEAASMLSMRHELTVKDLLNSMTATSSFLVRTVPKAILVYKLLRVKKQELELAAALQKLRRQGGDNIKEQFGILQQVQKVNMMRKNISERLGRVQ